MKKRLILLLAVLFVLAACGGETTEEPKDVNEKSNNTEKKDNAANEAESEDETEKQDEAEEENKETTIEKKPSTEEETEADKADEEDDNNVESNDEEKDKDIEKDKDKDKNKDKDAEKDQEEMTEEDMIDLAYLAFDAQAEEDYDYLESILSKGSTLNKDNNTIQFDNVTYPHEYEFLSKQDREFLSERYVQSKDDGKRYLIGFEVTDFANESSYIIDTVYIKESGEWKLNDMDINK